MKKILCLLLASLLVAFSLISCSGEDEDKGKKKRKNSAEKMEDIANYVEENKEAIAALGYELEARGTTVAFIYTLSEEEYDAAHSGELSDALKSITVDGKETGTMRDALQAIYGKDIKGVVFEYRAPDGTVLATEAATGK